MYFNLDLANAVSFVGKHMLFWLPPKAKITLANLAKVKKIPLAKSIFL